VDDSHVVFSENFLGENGCVRRCERHAIASSFVPKLRDEGFAHVHAVAVKCHSSIRNWLLDLQRTNSL
jgi:hypothetical protein